MNQLHFPISPQPDDASCGPTCLHSVYQYFSDEIPLEQVVSETGTLEEGGTLAVFLGSHALMRGYSATIYTYNLNVFDPTWFSSKKFNLSERLQRQAAIKQSEKLRSATDAYLKFLQLGGTIRMEPLKVSLIRKYLKRKIPILTGLSSTFLYGESRERDLAIPQDGRSTVPDDVGGTPSGHFVVLCGYDAEERTVLIADPFVPNPMSDEQKYVVDIDRVFASIMLGIVTYDANLLMIQPPDFNSVQ